MLRSSGKPYFFLKFFRRVCVCLRSDDLNADLRDRIRPWVIGRFACWVDRAITDRMAA